MSAALRRAVFLDRDGVINRPLVRDDKPFAPASLAELQVLPGVPAALGRLREAGFLNIVVTNQPDVGSGRVAREAVASIHDWLLKNLPLDTVKVCYHVDADQCECRKPKAGMLLEAAREFGVHLERSFMVGDRWRDVAAGQRAGCRSFFIDYGYREERPTGPYVAVNSLAHAAQLILESDGQ